MQRQLGMVTCQLMEALRLLRIDLSFLPLPPQWFPWSQKQKPSRKKGGMPAYPEEQEKCQLWIKEKEYEGKQSQTIQQQRASDVMPGRPSPSPRAKGISPSLGHWHFLSRT
jgi:hypothetical protein